MAYSANPPTYGGDNYVEHMYDPHSGQVPGGAGYPPPPHGYSDGETDSRSTSYYAADPSRDDLLNYNPNHLRQHSHSQSHERGVSMAVSEKDKEAELMANTYANARSSVYTTRSGANGPQPSHLRSTIMGRDANGVRPSSQWTVGFEPPPKSTGILRMWRKENRASWVKGGGFRTFFRLFSCCFLSFIFLLVSIVLTVLLWVRPPDIQLKGINIPSSNAVSVTSNQLTLKFDLDISVTNPNWFSADFSYIDAVARYPGNNTNDFGGGSLSNIKFPGNSGTTFAFPFTLNYTQSLDPNQAILKDLIAKCTASPAQDITIDYDLSLAVKILSVTVKPTISSSATFECPISGSDLAQLANSLGIGNLGGL